MVNGTEIFLSWMTFLLGLLSLTLSTVLFCRVVPVWRYKRYQLSLSTMSGDPTPPRLKRIKFRRALVSHLVVCMSAADIILSMWIVLSWGSIALSNSFALLHTDGVCLFLAFLNQLGGNGTCICYVLILYTLAYYFTQSPFPVIDNECSHRLIIIIALAVFMGIPLAMGKWGEYPNIKDGTRDYECMLSGRWWLAYYIPFFIAIPVSIVVWIRVEYLYHRKGKSSLMDAMVACDEVRHVSLDSIDSNRSNEHIFIQKSFVKRVRWLSFLFICAWIVPCGVRLYNVCTGNDVDLEWMIIHHITVALSPCANVFVWIQWDELRKINVKCWLCDPRCC